MRGVRCPVMVGREAELAELTDLVMRAAGGGGGVAFVLGEAGIGKSRLLGAAADVARTRGLAVLRGRAAHSSAPAPYRPVAEAFLSVLRGRALDDEPSLDRFRPALGVLVPGWGPPGDDPNPSVMLLGEAALALLRACAPDAGAVLVLEDLHSADAETCELVDYLSDKLDGTAVALLASVRTGDPSDGQRLAERLEVRRDAVVVRLAPLGAADVDTLIGASLGSRTPPPAVAEVVTAASGGVPLLAEELLTSLVDGGALVRSGDSWAAVDALPTLVPASFATIVGDRVARLGPDARIALEAAAVLGERFDWRLLVPLTGLHEERVVEGLRECARAQLVDEVPGPAPSFRFRHGLSRTAVLDAVPERERRHYARRGLDALEPLDGVASPDASPLELTADLAIAAGEDARAVSALVAAARAAATRGACTSARRSAELAAGLARSVEERVEAGEVLLDACAASGDPVAAFEVGARLLADLGRVGAPAERAGAVHVRLAAAAVDATDWERAESHVEHATALGDGCADALRGRLGLLRTAIALGRHDPHAAIGHAEATRQVALDRDDAHLLAEALALLGRAHRVTDVDSARHDFSEAVSAARRTGSQLLVARTSHELATLDVLLGGTADAMEQARRLAADAGAVALAAAADAHLAIIHWLRFDLDAARAAARRAHDAAVRYDLGLLVPTSGMADAMSAAVSGRRDEAHASFERLRPSMDAEIEATARGHVLALAAVASEDMASALAELARAHELAPRYSGVARAPHSGVRALLLATASDPRAATTAAGLAGDAAVVGVPQALVGLALAVLAGRDGDSSGATRTAEAAFDRLSATPWFLAVGRRLVAEAAIDDEWGDPVAWLRAALPFFERYGIAAPAEACRALLRRAGAAVPRGRAVPADPELAGLGVTPREAEVLALVATGLSNREIAERLYLSTRTVEKHVERLMTKTATSNRTQLAAIAARRPRGEGAVTLGTTT